MRCFVTGVAGFVGSHLAERLLADGHEVCGIDSFANDYDRTFKEHNLEGPRSCNMFHFIEGDLLEVALPRLLEGVDWIFHQAGRENGRAGWATPLTHYTESNVLITLRLLEAALRFGWVKRFVYASSSAVYGNAAHLPIHEDEVDRSRSPHGVTKLAAESLCSLYYERFGLRTISLRYFSVYGPRQRPDMAFHRFCKAIVCQEPLLLYGDGYQTRDFTYVEDVVEANIRAVVAREAIGQVINIGSGTSVTMRSVLELLEEITGLRINVVVGDSQHDDVRHICADTQRAQQLLDYRPRMDLYDGLVYQFEFIRDLYEHWPNLAARGALHPPHSNDGLPVPSEDPAATRKAMPVGPTAGPKAENSLLESQISELIANSMRGTESQPDTFTNREQQLQSPESSVYVSDDKEGEYANPVSSAKQAMAANLASSPILQINQTDSSMIRPLADENVGMSEVTAANLIAVLEPETGEVDSQIAVQTSQIDQADSEVVESIGDVVQRTEEANNYRVVSKETTANLTAVPKPDASQTDSQVVESIGDVVQRTEEANDYRVASKKTVANLTAVPKPDASQADSQVVESIGDVVQRTEAPIDTRPDVWQGQQTRQFVVTVPNNKADGYIPIPPEVLQAPTSPWVPPSRLVRPTSGYTEQNHVGVAILTLFLVGVLILGGCLAIYTQFVGSPSTQRAAASSATITITSDASKMLENTFSVVAVTNRPDAAQHQIKARQVIATTQPVSESVQVADTSTSADASANNTSQPTSSDQSTTTSSVVQQSNIDSAANDLESANTPVAASILQSQLAPNEQLVGNARCQPQVSANHKVGEVADTVTVTVVFSCIGEAYDQSAAEKMATQELTEQAKRDIGNAYVLSGQITAKVKDASISDVSQGTIIIPVDAQGTWVLELGADQQRAWANALAGKTKQAAQRLLQQKGIEQAAIRLQGGDGHTLPTDAKKITIKVQPIVGS